MNALKIINARLGSDHRLTEFYVENGYFVDGFSPNASHWQTSICTAN